MAVVRAMLCVLGLCGWAVASVHSPATAPSPDEIRALVSQLGHEDFAVREQASQRLADIGKPALDAVKLALTSDDPEVRGRAQSLVRRIQRHPVPGWDQRLSPDGGIVGRNLRVSVSDASKSVQVEQGAMRIRITLDAAGIDVTVSAEEEGRTITQSYKAREVDELKRLSPEAAELFDRWGGGPDRSWRMRIANAPAIVEGGEFNARAIVLEDELSIYRGRLERQMRDREVPEPQRRALRDLMDQMQAVQHNRDVVDAREKATERFLKLVDELREKLADLKLPDPGAALPPGARVRLGVGLRPPDPDGGEPAGLTVMEVTADGRGAKIGLKPGDIIAKANRQPVATIQELRRALEDGKGALQLDIQRDGRAMRLAE